MKKKYRLISQENFIDSNNLKIDLLDSNIEKNSFRIYTFNKPILNQDFSIEQKSIGTYILKLTDNVPKIQKNETWLLEYRIKYPSKRFEHQELNQVYTTLQEWAWDYLESSEILDWNKFWDIIIQAATQLLEPSLWWIKTSPTNNLTTFSDKDLQEYINWQPPVRELEDLEDFELNIDTESFKTNRQWIAELKVFVDDPKFLKEKRKNTNGPLDNKEIYKIYFVGYYPRPSSIYFNTLTRFAREISRIYYDLFEKKITKDSTASEITSWQNQDILSRLLLKIRGDIATYIEDSDELLEFKEILEMLFANNNFIISFLIEEKKNATYQYHFDAQQRFSLKEKIPNSIELNKLIETLPFENESYINQVRDSRLSLCKISIAENVVFDRVFGNNASVYALMLIPILGTIKEGKANIPAIIQIAWPKGSIPLVAEIQTEIQRAITNNATEILYSIQAYNFSKEYGRYEFVRSLSYFLGHNLPKTTVTPLMNLTHQLAKADMQEIPKINSRIKSIASLLDIHLHSLDVFRLPGSKEVKLEKMDFEALLKEMKELFTFLKEQKTTHWEEFVTIEEYVQLHITNNLTEDIIINGYQPAIFQILFIPIDNSLRALNPEFIKENPNRGIITMTLNANETGIEIIIQDQGIGIDPEKLQEINNKLEMTTKNALLENGLELYNNKAKGERLGLGLPLCAYFSALLHDDQGNYGKIVLDSIPNQQTKVILFIPYNKNQKYMNL